MRLIPLIFLALSVPAFAGPFPFSGKWQGQGLAVMKPGTQAEKTRRCTDVGLALEQSKTELKLLQGYYLCGDLQAHYDPSTFEIRDGQLVYHGQPVGSISDHQLAISYTDPEDESTFILTLTPGSGGLEYVEEWLAGGETQMRLKAALRQ